MTIQYTYEIATNSSLSFLKLLFRWKGSVYCYIWFELVVFTCLYGFISVIYNHILTGWLKESFEFFSIYCETSGRTIPMGFIFAFYINRIVDRWWNQFLTIPWPDEIALLLSAYTHGHSIKIQIQMKTILRYVNLSYCIVTRLLSSKAKNRFPTYQHLIAEGLINADELKCWNKSAPKNKPPFYGEPMIWASRILNEMRCENSIRSDRAIELIFIRLQQFRSELARIRLFNMINFPLVFSQIATIAVYSYCILAVFGVQHLNDSTKFLHKREPMVASFFGVLHFLFYMGLLKVAESLINPFGDDDDDFDIDHFIDRNVYMTDFLIDELHDKAPPLTRRFVVEWEENFLPKDSKHEISRNIFEGSLVDVKPMSAKRRFSLTVS